MQMKQYGKRSAEVDIKRLSEAAGTEKAAAWDHVSTAHR